MLWLILSLFLLQLGGTLFGLWKFSQFLTKKYLEFQLHNLGTSQDLFTLIHAHDQRIATLTAQSTVNQEAASKRLDEHENTQNEAICELQVDFKRLAGALDDLLAHKQRVEGFGPRVVHIECASHAKINRS